MSFTRKYGKQLSDTRLDSLKTASIKLVRKAGEFLGNKIADAAAKSIDDKVVKIKSGKEIIIPPEKREQILNESRQVL